MRISRPLLVLLAVAVLAGCGGATTKTYPRSKAYAIVSGCMKRAGARSVKRLHGDKGAAAFGPRSEWPRNFIQWDYVMSAGQVADVFDSDELSLDADAIRAKPDACLKPYGWSVS